LGTALGGVSRDSVSGAVAGFRDERPTHFFKKDIDE